MSGARLRKIVCRLQWPSLRYGSQEALSVIANARNLPAAEGSKRDFTVISTYKEDRVASCQRFTLFGACQQRGINVDTHGQEGEELSEKDYHRLADLTLGEIMVKLEALIEDTPGIADSDLEYSQGVLTLNLGSHGTYVINKQGPNKQIWMSSPVSGPVRYDLVNGVWTYKHDGHVFQERLAEELEDITGNEKVDLEQPPQVAKGFVGYDADPT